MKPLWCYLNIVECGEAEKRFKKEKDEKPENYPETFTRFMIHLFETSDQIKTDQKGEG